MQSRLVEIAPRVQYSTHEFGMRDARSILRSILGMPKIDDNFNLEMDTLACFEERWGPAALAEGRQILRDADGDIDAFQLVVDALERAEKV